MPRKQTLPDFPADRVQSYLRFSARFVDPSYGFAMGWFAAYNNAITVAAEATAVASLINYWNDTVSNGVWCALFLVSVMLLVSCTVCRDRFLFQTYG